MDKRVIWRRSKVSSPLQLVNCCAGCCYLGTNLVTIKNFSKDNENAPIEPCWPNSTRYCCIHVYGDLHGEESRVLHPVTEGLLKVFCSWSRKLEGAKISEGGFPSAYGYVCTVAPDNFLSICHLLRWVVQPPCVSWAMESLRGQSCLLCGALRPQRAPHPHLV